MVDLLKVLFTRNFEQLNVLNFRTIKVCPCEPSNFNRSKFVPRRVTVTAVCFMKDSYQGKI